jgi:hypothetical protein
VTSPDRPDRGAPSNATTRRHGAISLAAFTLSFVVVLLPGLSATGAAGRGTAAGGIGMLLWAVAFFYAIRAWRELGHVSAPAPMTRVLGHLPIILMTATFLALALATITAL